ncbi:MAG: sugar ABC transporter permease [Clostridiales bacterium]|nr:sugar ABC transporter permease [Clostridiales bacterium]
MTWKAIKRDFKMNWQIYLLAIPMIAYFITFSYIPMAGIVMAFQRFNPRLGYFRSPWIGLQNFKDFFGSYYFWRLIRNTFLISFYNLLFAFPAPIIFALLLNEVKNRYFKKTVQTISYMPHFISMVVIAGLIRDFTDTDGLITMIVVALGGQQRNLLSDPKLFRTIYVGSEIWQGIGFNSIIYLAALSSVDQELYEAAIIDGAGRWRQTWHITLPGIAPTIIIMLILRMGSLFSVGFEKIILLYTPMTYETADVISSFTYRKGLLENNYGYSTAVGLFNSVINFAMLLFANFLSRKYSETSLF